MNNLFYFSNCFNYITVILGVFHSNLKFIVVTIIFKYFFKVLNYIYSIIEINFKKRSETLLLRYDR